MKTKLFEFTRNNNPTLRGILTVPQDPVKQAVICLHGFERCSSTEKKFKKLADELLKQGIATLRLDFSGSGLSDGEFKDTTIEGQANDFAQALQALSDELGVVKISIVAHSLGACALAKQYVALKTQIEKIILLAPALNQRDLLRYRHVVHWARRYQPYRRINWRNYLKFFDEEQFIEDSKREDRMANSDYFPIDYFSEAKDIDFSQEFNGDCNNILHIHGDRDYPVPIESLNVEFRKIFIVRGGDHDLEKPWMIRQWLEQAVEFLLI